MSARVVDVRQGFVLPSGRSSTVLLSFNNLNVPQPIFKSKTPNIHHRKKHPRFSDCTSPHACPLPRPSYLPCLLLPFLLSSASGICCSLCPPCSVPAPDCWLLGALVASLDGGTGEFRAGGLRGGRAGPMGLGASYPSRRPNLLVNCSVVD